MEVYVVTNDESEEMYFAKYSDIEPSLKLSFSACFSVDITKSPAPTGGPTFTITGFMPGSENPFRHVFKVRRLTVHQNPTHF